MNKNNALQFLPLVQALADGKTLQYKYYPVGGTPLDVEWRDALDVQFGREVDQYRIKPEPKMLYCITNRAGSLCLRTHFKQVAEDQFDEYTKKGRLGPYKMETYRQVLDNDA